MWDMVVDARQCAGRVRVIRLALPFWTLIAVAALGAFGGARDAVVSTAYGVAIVFCVARGPGRRWPAFSAFVALNPIFAMLDGSGVHTPVWIMLILDIPLGLLLAGVVDDEDRDVAEQELDPDRAATVTA